MSEGERKTTSPVPDYMKTSPEESRAKSSPKPEWMQDNQGVSPEEDTHRAGTSPIPNWMHHEKSQEQDSNSIKITEYERIFLEKGWLPCRERIKEIGYYGVIQEQKNLGGFNFTPRFLSREEKTRNLLRVAEVYEELSAKYPKDKKEMNGFYMWKDRNKKLYAYGVDAYEPNPEEYTKIYLTASNTDSPDIFKELVEQCSESGLCQDMLLALNLSNFPTREGVEEKLYSYNTIISYIPRGKEEIVEQYLNILMQYVNNSKYYMNIDQKIKDWSLELNYQTLTIPFAEGLIRLTELEKNDSWDLRVAGDLYRELYHYNLTSELSEPGVGFDFNKFKSAARKYTPSMRFTSFPRRSHWIPALVD